MGEPRYRALLIGAADYGTPGISPLPFIPQDLERMSAALIERGFHEAAVAQFQLVTPNEVNGEVTRFLGEAERGDRLLVVLSGHGVHSRGKDYLVPEDIRAELLTFARGCIEIDWREEIEESRAEQVVFLIDACREGIDRDTKGTAAWSNRKATGARGRRVAYVYACSAAEVARFVREDDAVRDGHAVGTEPRETFSLFSRAVTDLLGAGAGAGNGGPVSGMRDFRTAVQGRIDALHAAYGKPGRAQRIRVLSETPEEEFVVLPPAVPGPADASSNERTWHETVMTHPAWRLTAPEFAPAVERLREVCGDLVSRYARTCDGAPAVLAEDPWYDEELGPRTAARVGFLLRRLVPGTVLSPTEAALLAVLPYAGQAHWVRLAEEWQPREPELDAFLERFPRLGRRIRNLSWQSEALRQIRWWAYHRWLARQPKAFGTDDNGAGEGDWTRSELSAPQLLRYLKEQRFSPVSAPGTARGTDLVDARDVAPSTADEHTVRERLVAALLKAAHALAIDPADLPEVLAEHLGISDAVRLDELLTTVRQSQWLASGAGRTLRAVCQHPAVHLALAQHTEEVDGLLRELNRLSATADSSLAPLADLPAYAHAQDVQPASDTPYSLPTGIRFRLDEDRVRELLMGEQLYKDRSLAIRELYQNALDACRYREARVEYLARTGDRGERDGGQESSWQGEITFTEGRDEDGRAYLECTDNGIGMGVTELTHSFSQGGARFVDLPEFVEERGQWDALDPPVTLAPVSRFGIGVLSYFMIADEITVWTCRLDRDGRPGRLLKVTIAGPGTLFRVEDLGQGEEAGTRVRLHAAADQKLPSCGETLGKQLMVAPYLVTVRGTGRERIWRPGELLMYGGRVPAQPSPANEVWWLSDAGRVLVDGLSTDRNYSRARVDLQGRTVNLHGAHAQLSVDRREIIEYDRAAVHDRCVAAIDDLMGRPDLLTPEWLLHLYGDDGELADAILSRAIEGRLSWDTQHGTIEAGRTGLFPPDLLLLPTTTGSYGTGTESAEVVAPLLVRCLPEPLVRWRLRALLGLGTEAPPVGRPIDLKLFSVDPGADVSSWTVQAEDARGRLARARTVTEPDEWGPPLPGDETEESYELNALWHLFPWRHAHRPLLPEEVLDTAHAMTLPVRQVAERLRALGYQVPPLGALDLAVPEDFPLLALPATSHYIDNASKWLPCGGYVHLAHLLGCQDPVKSAERLTELGYRLPADIGERAKDWPEFNDARLALARQLMNHAVTVPATPAAAANIRLYQLWQAAKPLQTKPDDLSRALTRWGFTVSGDLPEDASGEPEVRVPTWRDAFRAEHYDQRHPEILPVPTYPGRSDSRFRAGDLTPIGNASVTHAVLTPAALRTAAEIADLPERSIRAAIKAERVAVPDTIDPGLDELLARSFPATATTGDRITPGTPIRLAELASAALTLRRTFREVAARATELGFEHEARDWFTDAADGGEGEGGAA
ncbi:caspase family protein [Streptomyces monticola]|uniref:Caspase family protein n=1 Tax=Streptomyces monticola TaxID=2666263 RepID=A0ABW2JLD3_9ACTN